MKPEQGSRSAEEKNRRRAAELRLYRCLGVVSFQKAIFAVERYLHRRDGGRNRNYHLEHFSAEAAGAYEGFLLYHTVLHVFGLLLGILLAGSLLLQGRWGVMGVLLTALCLLNIWCIMLQRYNGLRLRHLRERKSLSRRRRAAAEAGHIPEECRRECGAAERDLIDRILGGLASGQSVFLTRQVVPCLNHLTGLLEGIQDRRKWTRKPAETERQSSENSEIQIDRLIPDAGLTLYQPWDVRLEQIWRVFSREKNCGPLSRCCIVTEDLETETAYGRLFGGRSSQNVLERLLLLRAALDQGTRGEDVR